MAAPTDVRVEAQSITSTILRWTYAGSAGLGVYRSTDGISYSVITSPLLPSSDTSYTDTGLAAATKYYYKLSDDVGMTFSSVVTVTTHTCLSAAGALATFSLPRLGGPEDLVVDPFNNLAERIESTLGGRLLTPNQCIACPSDGAIVIDCSNGCTDWVVIADEDINSISLQWCNGPPGNIEFIVPPNTSGRQICGWPAGFGFSGDECSKAPITTGASGTSISTGIGGASGRGSSSNPSSKRNYNLFAIGTSGSGGSSSSGSGTTGSSSSGGSGSGGSDCTCVPAAGGALTIKSCNSNNSLKCSTTKSLKLLVCGGRGPYNWSRTGSVNLKGSGAIGATATGTAITVTPPTNSGSAVAGTAYKEGYFKCSACGSGACTAVSANVQVLRNCDDTSSGCSTVSPCGTEGPASAATCGCGGGSVGQPGCGASPPTCTDCGVEVCSDYQAGNVGGSAHVVCDVRTAPMVAAGCNPCGLNEGATVSVTDAAGTVVTIILKV